VPSCTVRDGIASVYGKPHTYYAGAMYSFCSHNVGFISIFSIEPSLSPIMARLASLHAHKTTLAGPIHVQCFGLIVGYLSLHVGGPNTKAPP
jgi:hypothetical protein